MQRCHNSKICYKILRKAYQQRTSFFSKVKNAVGRLASVGYAKSDTDHVEAILNGLPAHYDTFIVSVNSRYEA